MRTQWSAKAMALALVEDWTVVADFDGDAITPDTVALLLDATDRAIRLGERFAGSLTAGRDPLPSHRPRPSGDRRPLR